MTEKKNSPKIEAGNYRILTLKKINEVYLNKFKNIVKRDSVTSILFSEGPTNQNSTFTIFRCLFVKKENTKKSFCFFYENHLLIVKVLPVTLCRCSEAAIMTYETPTGTCLWSEIPYRKPPRIFPASNEGWTRQKIDQS
jgi:hypothetical protein